MVNQKLVSCSQFVQKKLIIRISITLKVIILKLTTD